MHRVSTKGKWQHAAIYRKMIVNCVYQDVSNQYAVPMAMGICHRLESHLDITSANREA
jgi:lysozyme family protein